MKILNVFFIEKENMDPRLRGDEEKKKILFIIDSQTKKTSFSII